MSTDPLEEPLAHWRREFPSANLRGLELSGRLRALEHDMERLRAEQLAPFDLDAREWDVLSALWRRRDASVSMSDLATELLVVAGSVTHRVSGLERRGYVQRTMDPDSRRRVLVTLTPAGTERVQAALPTVIGIPGAAKSDLTDDELAQLNTLLRRLHIGLRKP